MENKVIAKEYVDKNYIKKDIIQELFNKMTVNISDIEPWSFYKIPGDVLFNLERILEDK